MIGGGDTGSDCVGTSIRHGAASVTQIEVMPRPAEQEDKALTWPNWPLKLRTSSSQEEGCARDWSVTTKACLGTNGKVEKLSCVRVEWKAGKMVEIPGSEFEMQADLVLLAMGFVSPVQKVLEAFGVEKDGRGNAKATTDGAGCYKTRWTRFRCRRHAPWPVAGGVGDTRRPPGARAVDEYLMGCSDLPR